MGHYKPNWLISSTIVAIVCLFILGSKASGVVITPQKNIDFSFSYRARIESWDNAIGFDKDADASTTWLRNRLSYGITYKPSPTFDFGLKLTDEFRYYLNPAGRACSLDEIVVDQLYVTWREPFRVPVDITLGRRNLKFGEGFIIMDGTPLDGSRTGYFNAARIDWRMDNAHLLSAFYLYQQDYDTWLPIINDQDRLLIEQPEEGLGLHWAYAAGGRSYSAYLIRKNIHDTDNLPVTWGINTLGARLSAPVIAQLGITAEAACQTGKRDNNNLSAFGGFAYTTYSTGWAMKLPKTISIGGLYLSGDDPGTPEWEGWEPLWGRWPLWSESYLYSLLREEGVGYWTNLASIFVKTAINISSKSKLLLTYHHLFAPEIQEADSYYGAGNHRGDLFIARLDYGFDANLTGHFLVEHFDPGDFYFDSADDYLWVRFEIMMQY